MEYAMIGGTCGHVNFSYHAPCSDAKRTEHSGSSERSAAERTEYGCGSGCSITEHAEHPVLGRISYVYICGALLTTWSIVLNFLTFRTTYAIDLLLGTEHILSYTRPV